MDNIEAKKAAADLIYLVSCAVNGEKTDPKKCAAMNLKHIYKLALFHGLTIAACNALEQSVKLPEYLFQSKYQIIRRLSLFNIERKKVMNKLEENGIWYLPLKGAVIREMYDNPALREMSDNDILFDSERAKDVKRIMTELGFKCTKFGASNHDVYSKSQNVLFEMHRSLFSQYKRPELYALYADIKDKLVLDENRKYGYHMTPEDFYAYLLCHMYKHYSQGGVGLRSLLDIYIFNKKQGASLNWEYLGAELEKQKLTDYEKSVRKLSWKAFTGQPLSEEEQRELDFYSDSNCFGSDENVLAQKLNNDDSGSAKRSYVKSRIFQSDTVMQEAHPFIYQHKVLYPFWVVFRLGKAMVTKPKKVIREYKRVKNFKKKDNLGAHNQTAETDSKA